MVARQELAQGSENLYSPGKVAVVFTMYTPDATAGVFDPKNTVLSRAEATKRAVKTASEAARVVIAHSDTDPVYLRELERIGGENPYAQFPIEFVERPSRPVTHEQMMRGRSYMLPSQSSGIDWKQHEAGLVTGHIMGLQRAFDLGAELGIRSEPEKDIWNTENVKAVAAPILAGRAKVVGPSRKRPGMSWKESLSTLPDYMCDSEAKANEEINALLRENGYWSPGSPDIDWMFGPIAISRDVFDKVYTRYQYIKKEGGKVIIDPTERQFITLISLSEGLGLESVELPYFRYPPELENNEMINRAAHENRRKAQFKEEIGRAQGFIDYLKGKNHNIAAFV